MASGNGKFFDYWMGLNDDVIEHNSPEQLRFRICDLIDDVRIVAHVATLYEGKAYRIAEFIEIADALRVDAR